jgi:DNA-binding MarR family transcriptional regulator
MRTTSKKEFASIFENRLYLLGKRKSIIVVLTDSKELSESQIAELLSLDLGNLSGYIRELEEAGLVDTRKGKEGKGNDRVMVSLSKRSFESISSLKEDEKPYIELGEAPEELLSYFLKQLLETDEETRRYASREMKDICRASRLTEKSELFTWLEGRLNKEDEKEFANSRLYHEKDREVLLDLLTALEYATSNSPETIQRIKTDFINPIKAIASGYSKVDDPRVLDKAIDLIVGLHDGEYGYKLLLDVYKALLEKESSSATTAIKALAKYTNMNEQLHKDLMEFFKIASKEKRGLIKGHRANLLPAFK